MPLQHYRRVHFREDCNVTIPSLHFCKDDTRDLWYTQLEYIAFNQELSDTVSTIIRNSTTQGGCFDPSSLSGKLSQLYRAFQDAQSPQAARSNIQSIQIEMNDQMVGLERIAVPYIPQDSLLRRNVLMRQVRYLQSQRTLPPTQRELLIQKAVRAQSRVSRLYARYVAHAATNDSKGKQNSI